jgi:hypothetical protein
MRDEPIAVKLISVSRIRLYLHIEPHLVTFSFLFPSNSEIRRQLQVFVSRNASPITSKYYGGIFAFLTCNFFTRTRTAKMKFRRPTPSSTAPTSLKQVQAILDSTTTTKGNTDRCLTVFRTPFCQTRSNLPPLSSTHTTHSIIIAVMCEWLRWKCLCLLCHRVCFFTSVFFSIVGVCPRHLRNLWKKKKGIHLVTWL